MVDENNNEPVWSLENIQAYIAYVKSEFKPELNEEAEKILQKYYVLQRSADTRNAARTTVKIYSILVTHD